MLKKLFIKNYALIDEIDVSFDAGFSTITGETGAGKSIILGALSLVLGERAETSSIREGEKKCIIEAEFLVPESLIANFFEKNELDYEQHSILRREIHVSGKSRAFINDTPVSLKHLRDLSSSLIDIHSQNENISLNQADFQLKLLDDYAGIGAKRKAHELLFSLLNEKRNKLAQLKDEQAQNLRNRDFWQFQFDEIEELQPSPGENELLEEKLRVIAGAEELKTTLYQVNAELGEHDSNILSALRGLENKLSAFKSISENFDELFGRLSSVRIELEDVHAELEYLSSEVDFDEEALTKTEERLNQLNHLLQKHRLKTTTELIALSEELLTKLAALDHSDDELKALEQEIQELEQNRKDIAAYLSDARKAAKSKLEKNLVSLLTRMQIPDARIEIAVESARVNAFGEDHVNYLFSANKGQKPQAIGKVASGGERSRLMLALRFVLSEKSELPAIILDEIDAGISGEVAKRVGEVLQEMAARMQVISITHLPQIAAKGQDHKWVYKTDGKTFIKSLKGDERILEIAQMLSGSNPGEEAQLNARQLLN